MVLLLHCPFWNLWQKRGFKSFQTRFFFDFLIFLHSRIIFQAYTYKALHAKRHLYVNLGSFRYHYSCKAVLKIPIRIKNKFQTQERAFVSAQVSNVSNIKCKSKKARFGTVCYTKYENGAGFECRKLKVTSFVCIVFNMI